MYRFVCLFVFVFNVPVNNFYSHVGMEQLLLGYLSILLGAYSVLLKDTLQWTWGLNRGPLALVSDALPLSHRGSPNWFVLDLVSTQSDQHLFTAWRLHV